MFKITPRPFDPKSQSAYADAFRRDECGLVVGLEFCATLLPRTPLWILNHHGELWTDKTADPPNYGSAGDGIWTMALPWRSSKSTTPSRGPPEYDKRVHLLFFRQFRRIIESDMPACTQCDAIVGLIEGDPRFIHLANFFKWNLPRSFFIGRLMELDGVGRGLANRLFEAGIVTPEMALDASEQELRSVRGIGQATMNRIRRSFVHQVIWPPAPVADPGET